MNEVLLSTFSNSELTYWMKEFEIAKHETLVEKADFDIGFFKPNMLHLKIMGIMSLEFHLVLLLPFSKIIKTKLLIVF